MHKACDWLTKEAARYGADLSFKYRFFTIDTPKDIANDGSYAQIKDFFNSENINMDQLQKRYEAMSGSDESPFILVFDKTARSFARRQSMSGTPYNELSVMFRNIYTSSFLWTTIAHELLHQFGAIDYYYPEEVTECAKIYIKDSIMGVGRDDVLDDLTAYIVGIKDTISASTYHFLEKTMWVDYEKFVKHLNDA